LLNKTYHTKFGVTTAVDAVSFAVVRGAAFGLVGESGSGKSTIARMLVGLEQPDSGKIVLDGSDIARPVRGKSARLARARLRQIVFQDPYLSLDPRIPIGKAVEDVLRLHYPRRTDHKERVLELLNRVGLGERQAQAVPRNLSGGQRQRAAIAKALAVDPELLVLDESTSALDVSVQAQVLELLSEIRRERGLSIVFVSHDLAVVQQLCEETLVLQRGKAVEQGPTRELLSRPSTAYTRLLVDSVPRADWDLAELALARTAVGPAKI
jgi:ABC-type glutathione transport system ATPase component